MSVRCWSDPHSSWIVTPVKAFPRPMRSELTDFSHWLSSAEFRCCNHVRVCVCLITHTEGSWCNNHPECFQELLARFRVVCRMCILEIWRVRPHKILKKKKEFFFICSWGIHLIWRSASQFPRKKEKRNLADMVDATHVVKMIWRVNNSDQQSFIQK